MTQKLSEKIDAGWYTEYSNDDYHFGKLKDLISHSDLINFAQSPAHYYNSKFNSKESTPTQIFGSAFHSVCMEFESEVVVMPEINRRTKQGKQEYAAFTEENKDKHIVSAMDRTHIKSMVDAVNKHKYAKRLIETDHRELTGIFYDSPTELWCKIRPDYINYDKQIIVDLKATNNASQNSFSKDIFNFAYNWQAAWYIYGAQLIELKDYTFIIIAVEKAPPYGVNTFVINDQALYMAQEKIFSIINNFAECFMRYEWPCYAQKLIEIEVPRWMKAKRIYE